MAKPKPIEEMVIKSVYGPKRLLDRPGLSEHVVGLLEQEYIGKKPEDPRLSTIQTILSEYVTANPGIIREWKFDDLRAERIIRQNALKEHIEATSSEISEIMTKIAAGDK